MKLITSLAIAGTAAAQLFSKCPNDVTLKQNFDPEKYLGTWYEM
jgi:lipocalin